jgi:hypothetical protein
LLIATLCLSPERRRVHCPFRLYLDQNIDLARLIEFLRVRVREGKTGLEFSILVAVFYKECTDQLAPKEGGK